LKRFLTFLAAVLLMFSIATAEDSTVFVLCQPDSFVNVRMFPNKEADIAGRVELGWTLETDGRKKNGFLHVFGGFEDDAWIHAGYVTAYPVTIRTFETEINAHGRVACRRSIKGTRRKWLSDGQKVTVYALADDWAITNQGFIQTRFLGVF
jgi:hypothetical protein